MKLRFTITIAIIVVITLLLTCGRTKSHEGGAIDDNGYTSLWTEEGDSSHYEHLKELSWLVGTWVDENEQSTISSSFKWWKNKNFLIQHFTIHMQGRQEFEGHQIIGWDPVLKRIRSWVFDSAGGFGKSFWLTQDSSWYATMAFTTADGKKASATHVYTKINANSYTFSSEGRDMDGQWLPNIGPFTVIRKQ